MITKANIFKFLKMLMMAGLVVFMLTACRDNDNSKDTSQGPLPAGQETFDPTHCWQTEIVDTLYDLMGTVAIATYKKMTGGAMALMMVIFALWMSKRLLAQLGSFKEENLGKVWTEIAKMFFLCMACGAIASQAKLLVWTLGDIIFPIYNAFLEFAGEILKAGTDDINGSVSLFGKNFDVVSSEHPIVCAVSKVEYSKDPTGFPDSPKQMMDCMICSISHSLSFGMAVALEIMTRTKFLSWLIGLMILACFLFVKLGFVFYLVDTIFRFTVMVVMLPIMIMGFPFKSSRGVLSKGVQYMLNSAAFMLFFALIITMCIQALNIILTTFKDVFVSEASLAEFGVPFICMMMIAFLVVSSIQIAGKLCDSIVGGKSNPAFQQSAKALIIGAAKWVLSGGLKFASIFIPAKWREGFNNTINKGLHLAGQDKGGK